MEHFQPSGRYQWPTFPTEHALKRFLRPILKRLRHRDDAPHVAKDRLRRTSTDPGAARAAQPACGILQRELAATLDEWASSPNDVDSLRLVILPPCEESDLIEHWARANGHRLVTPPRMDLATLALEVLDPTRVEFDCTPPPDPLGARLTDLVPDLRPIEDGEIFVIPRLEHWFLRHPRGLGLVRALLDELDTSKRRHVVGCNSWAWGYLQKAIGADLILPRGMTFCAFDADRLRKWFVEPGVCKRGEDLQTTFRLAKSGDAVLRIPSQADGSPADESVGKSAAGPANDAGEDYFRTLAAHSLGIPWVAWRTWHESLRSRIDPDDEGESDGRSKALKDRHTVWISDFEDFVLPPGREQDSLLVLHALLLHDALDSARLRAVLPSALSRATVPALLSAGLIEHSEHGLRCRALAYPAIRRELVKAGFPVDRL